MSTDYKLDPRQEKNRHHLATVLSLSFGTSMLSIAYILLPSPFARFVILTTAGIMALMYIGRTFVIETGVRRHGLPMEVNFERKSRTMLQRYFGIVFQEDIPRLTDRTA